MTFTKDRRIDMTQTVGILGLGIMGGAMAANLLKAGHTVVGFDISQEALVRFGAAGGKALGSVAEVMRGAAVVIASLPTVKAFETVYAEIAAAAGANNVVIDTCTMPLSAKTAALALLEGSQCRMLDCPVSGTGAQAVTKDLVVFGSGDADAFEKARPVLECISRKQVYLGDFGRGSSMKFIANLLVNIHNVAAAEAITLGIKAGIDPATVVETLKDSAATSRMFQMRGPLMVQDRYDEPTARISLHMKDLGIITGFAEQLNCPVPLFTTATQLYHAAMSQGLEGEDTAAVCRVLESMAGIKR